MHKAFNYFSILRNKCLKGQSLKFISFVTQMCEIFLTISTANVTFRQQYFTSENEIPARREKLRTLKATETKPCRLVHRISSSNAREVGEREVGKARRLKKNESKKKRKEKSERERGVEKLKGDRRKFRRVMAFKCETVLCRSVVL